MPRKYGVRMHDDALGSYHTTSLLGNYLETSLAMPIMSKGSLSGWFKSCFNEGFLAFTPIVITIAKFAREGLLSQSGNPLPTVDNSN